MSRKKPKMTHPIFGTVTYNPPNGYLRISSVPYRDQYLHRAVWERIAGFKLPDGWHVHHMDHNKQNCCGCNLIAMPDYFHLAFGGGSIRHPYTGKWVSREHYERVMGVTLSAMCELRGGTVWVIPIDITPGANSEVSF